jgi:hypothetical protein
MAERCSDRSGLHQSRKIDAIEVRKFPRKPGVSDVGAIVIALKAPRRLSLARYPLTWRRNDPVWPLEGSPLFRVAKSQRLQPVRGYLYASASDG